MTDKSVLLRLGADASGLTTGLKQGKQGLKEFDEAVVSSVEKLERMAEVLGLGLGLASLTEAALHFSESITRVSLQTGMSTDEAQRLNLIAAQTGTTVEALAGTVNKMQKSLVAADEDGKKAAATLSAIGLSVDQLLARSPSDQLMEIAKGLAEVHDPAQRSAEAIAILGKSGAEALPTLLTMAEKADELAAGMERIGGPVSADAIEAVHTIGDEVAVTKQAFVNLATELLGEAAPALVAFLHTTQEVIGGLRILGGAGDNASANLDRDIEAAEAKLLQMEETVSGQRWNPFANYTPDDIAKARQLVDSLRAQQEALNGTGEGGRIAAQQDKELTTQFLANINEINARTLDAYSQDGAAFQELAALKIDVVNENYGELEAIAAQMSVKKIDAQTVENESLQQLAQDHESILYDIHAAGLDRIAQFRAMSWDQQVSSVAGSLEQMTAGVAQHSKGMFEINKAAGIANAVINTARGVTNALGAFPPPLSFVMAAVQAAAGLAQINAIRSQQFNGGGAGLPPSQAATAPTNVASAGGGGGGGNGGSVMRVEGITPDSIVNGKMVRRIADQLSEHVRDGGRVEWDQ
jgi:hypothetical protein